MGPRVTLTVTKGLSPNALYTFERQDTLIIGRSADCGARTAHDDTAASRHHCVVEIDPPRVIVRDLGSHNGTFVNGVKSAVADLKTGDVITVGTTEFVVTVEEMPPEDARPAADVPHVDGYEFVSKLGEGGMGVVYAVRRKSDGGSAAIKVMHARGAVHERSRQMFLREIDVMSQLRHPNIVEMYEHGSVGRDFYIVMELCERGSLDQLLQARGGCLPLDEAVSMIVQVLDGLAEAHTRGLVHRDIKPQNILLADCAKVADLGLAKNFQKAGLSGMTMSGTAAGTPRFMPREQITEFKYATPAADVWSVGATLYAMLTGAVPREFPEGRSAVDIVLHEDAVPIRDRDPRIAKRLADVIDRSLADNLSVRYPSASEFREALIRAI